VSATGGLAARRPLLSSGGGVNQAGFAAKTTLFRHRHVWRMGTHGTNGYLRRNLERLRELWLLLSLLTAADRPATWLIGPSRGMCNMTRIQGLIPLPATPSHVLGWHYHVKRSTSTRTSKPAGTRFLSMRPGMCCWNYAWAFPLQLLELQLQSMGYLQ
jgi:hypothetical protein